MTKPVIGIVGLGRLGLPVAVAINQRGYDVVGFDLNEARMSKLPQSYKEEGYFGFDDFNDTLALSTITFAKDINSLVEQADIIFIAVQTPHDSQYGGEYTFHIEHLQDFDYRYLKNAISSVANACEQLSEHKVVAVISTMLPGTWHKHLRQITNDYTRMVYNPFFIAMGSVMRDFLNPEFVLLGLDSSEAANALDDFYRDVTANDAPRVQMSIPSAEATKVLYNTYISAKISVINTAQMVCDSIKGCDVNEVLGALRLGTKRLLSTQYMGPGMGDAGGCHPRDNLALGWLMRSRVGRVNKANFFASIMHAREDWALYLAEKLLRTGIKYGIPIGIYGYAFKRGVAITDGSHALLVAHLLTKRFGNRCYLHDPVIDGALPTDEPRVYLVGCNHAEAETQEWVDGTVVLDPWHIVPLDAPGAKVLRVG